MFSSHFSHQQPMGGICLGRLQVREPLLIAPALCCTAQDTESMQLLKHFSSLLADLTEYQKGIQCRRRTSPLRAQRLPRQHSKCCVPIKHVPPQVHSFRGEVKLRIHSCIGKAEHGSAVFCPTMTCSPKAQELHQSNTKCFRRTVQVFWSLRRD